MVERYRAKLSGPLLDRIDVHCEVARVDFKELAEESSPPEGSEQIRARVVAARQMQAQRFGSTPVKSNAMMDEVALREHCLVDEAGRRLLENAMDRLSLSARAYSRIIKVARTIADLDQSPTIKAHHLAEAIQYRVLDRRLEL